MKADTPAVNISKKEKSQTSSAAGNDQQPSSLLAQIDYTKQAREIVRLQKETPSVTERSATTVQIEKPSGEDTSGVPM